MSFCGMGLIRTRASHKCTKSVRLVLVARGGDNHARRRGTLLAELSDTRR